MKTALLILVLGAVAVLGATVTLEWERSPAPDVVGYRIYFGTNAGHYIGWTNVGDVARATVTVPGRGRWYFAATAMDAAGEESDFSNEVFWDFRPGAPVLTKCGPRVLLVPVLERSTNLVNWSPLVGEPIEVPADQAQEFFRLHSLYIEPINDL